MTEPERSVCGGEVRHDRFGWCGLGHAQELVLEVDDELRSSNSSQRWIVERRGEGSAVGENLKSFA